MRVKIAFLIALCSVVAAISSNRELVTAKARTAITYDCEGDACAQVTLTWDDTKQQYRVQNNSSNQWVRVEAANLAATAMTCVAAGKTEYLSLTSIVGAYRAKYDATCADSE